MDYKKTVENVMTLLKEKEVFKQPEISQGMLSVSRRFLVKRECRIFITDERSMA